MGFSLEALFGPTSDGPHLVDPLPAWDLDHQVDHINIQTELNPQRIADGVVAYHGIDGALGNQHNAVSVDISAQIPGRDLLLTIRRPDSSSFVIAQSLRLGQQFRMAPTYRHLLSNDAATTLVAVETEDEWSLVHLTAHETHVLHGAPSHQTNSVLRDLGFLDT